MMTWWLRTLGATAVACVALSACGGQKTEESTSANGGTPLSRTNPSDFPLYPGTSIVEVAPVDYGPMFAMIRKNDPSAKLGQNYRGHEVIASTAATMVQLRGWVAHLKSAPPAGFHVASTSGTFSIDTTGKSGSSEAGGLFETANSQRVVLVLALDPRQIREQLGPALDLIDKYQAVPPMLRGTIDDQMKRQMGYTVTEMLDRRSPIGVVFATIKSMGSTDRRAIVLVDETKYAK